MTTVVDLQKCCSQLNSYFVRHLVGCVAVFIKVFRQVIKLAETESNKDSPSTEKYSQYINKVMSEIFEKVDKGHALLKEREISKEEKLQNFTVFVESELSSLFNHIFPKTCLMCGTIYDSLDEYLKDTGKTAEEINSGSDNWDCKCGANLIVRSISNRRDTSVFGDARRRLFDMSLQRLKEISADNQEELRDHLRKSFNKVINRLERHATEPPPPKKNKKSA